MNDERVGGFCEAPNRVEFCGCWLRGLGEETFGPSGTYAERTISPTYSPTNLVYPIFWMDLAILLDDRV